MGESNLGWLREHMREHVANTSVTNSTDNILNSQRPSFTAKNPGQAVLGLVYKAVELIGDVDNYAAERHARAEALALQAIEKLKISDDRIRAAESARHAAEAEIETINDRVEKEISAKVQELKEAMERTESRIVATEVQLTAAEQRAKAAELRADEAENALKHIEDAIRTQIIEKRLVDLSRKSVRAA